MAAIELEGLEKQFGSVQALSGIDLTVEEGEVFGFLGPNGAGKSTTIDILLDFVRPTAGTARVFGMDTQAETLAVRKRTGVLPDGYQVYNRLTGRQHLDFVIDSKEAADDPDAMLERVGIADAADRAAGEYSKGMRQRLALGMALVGDPDLLILDEPSTGLDPAGAREIRELVREETARGTTIFFSSHVLGQVEAVADRVGILRDGELVAVDTVEGLRDAVGTGSRIVVTVDDVDAALAAARDVESVTDATAGEGEVTVAVGDGPKTAILEAIESAGVTVSDFRTEEASLEELFLAYTEES